ncbi:MAG: hypothetical protein E5V93_22170, partial [Mesorhizobium sp.]
MRGNHGGWREAPLSALPGISPLKGGDQMSRRLSPIASVVERSEAPELPISPLEGEMAGRPERGGS